MSQCKKPFGPVTYHCIEDEGHTGDHKYEWTLKVLPSDIKRSLERFDEAVALLQTVSVWGGSVEGSDFFENELRPFLEKCRANR